MAAAGGSIVMDQLRNSTYSDNINNDEDDSNYQEPRFTGVGGGGVGGGGGGGGRGAGLLDVVVGGASIQVQNPIFNPVDNSQPLSSSSSSTIRAS